MKDITALILAGGDSTRLWPIEEKHFVRFFGKPLVYRCLSQLQKFGFANIVIVVNGKNKPLFEKLITEFKNISISLIQQKKGNGMSEAVISAEKLISGRKILVIGPSDIYEDTIFADLNGLLEDNPEGILAGTVMDKYFPGGYMTINKGIITKIIEKPLPSKIPSHIVNFVFDYFKDSSKFIQVLKKIKSNKDDTYEKAISLCIDEGLIFKFLEYKGYWGYLKYPWHILSLSSYFLSTIKENKIKKASISKSATIEGNVFIEDGVKIMENVKISGPCYIGKNTIIGNNSFVRESIIGANCVVGYSTEIARSYVGDNSWFHNNYVGDSVLLDNVSMGAGGVTANYRFDSQTVFSLVGKGLINTERTKFGMIAGFNVRIGVNASIMPGVKVGNNSFVGPSVLLDKDLGDNKFCSCQSKKYKITNNKVSLI